MSEEVKAYEPKPRGAARIAGVDLASIDARLEECEAFFLKHVDETDYRNLDWYLQRGQLRFAAGDDIYEVIDDAFLAARCLHDRHAMHLELKPPEMFMTRRITPVELGIISGMPMLTLEFSSTFGLPLMMIMSQTAPEEIQNEANLMTSYFRRSFCADYYELASLSAVIYAGVIAALGRGFDDEAILGLSTYAKARDSLRGMPPASLLPKIKRYDALNTALACICNGSFELIPGILAPLAEAFLEDQQKRGGPSFLAPEKMPSHKYFDLSILTIMALTALRESVLEFPEQGAIAHYNDFTRGFMEMPERRIEMPALNEEARRILEQAGVDPDQLNRDYAEDTFRSAKEESEAKARDIFDEKQRQVQRVVQERIAQGIAQEEAHTSIEPVVYVHEDLKLDDEKVEAAGRFASFFEGDNRDEEAERRANFYGEDEDDDSGEKAATGKSFDGFFEGKDERSELNRDEEEASTREDSGADGGKNFSAFFDKKDALDAAIRETVENDDQHDRDAGKNFGSFFENLEPNAIAPFDDGSNDKPVDSVDSKAFTKDFFATDGPQTELAMASESTEDDEPTETDAIKEFTANFFVDDTPRSELQMEDPFAPRVEEAKEFTTDFFVDDAPKAQLQMEATALPSVEKAPNKSPNPASSGVAAPSSEAPYPRDTAFTSEFFANDPLRADLQKADEASVSDLRAPNKSPNQASSGVAAPSSEAPYPRDTAFTSEFFANDPLRTDLQKADEASGSDLRAPNKSPKETTFTHEFFANDPLRTDLQKADEASGSDVRAAKERPIDTTIAHPFFANDPLRTDLQKADEASESDVRAPREHSEGTTVTLEISTDKFQSANPQDPIGSPSHEADAPMITPKATPFTREFCCNDPLETHCQKTDDSSAHSTKADAAKAPVSSPSASTPAEEKRDFTKIFTAPAPGAAAALKMAVDDATEQKLVAAPKEADPVIEFQRKTAETLRQEQIREIEEAHAQKLLADAAAKEANRLKLQADENEAVMPKLESFDERAARLILEKQAAIRESALRERAEAERELEELKAKGVQRPIVEALQLTPDAPRDADDVVERVGFEDLVIQGFAYTDLDMIHANTAIKEELEEDIDMQAALNEQRAKEAETKNASGANALVVAKDEDFDMHAALIEHHEREAEALADTEGSSEATAQEEDIDMRAALAEAKKQEDI